MKPALSPFPVLLVVLMSCGCSTMSGLGGNSSYACQAPDGVSCESVAGTYANALAGNLPAQRKQEKSAPVGPRMAPPPPAPEPPGLALRSQAKYLRLWMKPWVDIDGDLYNHAYIYVQIDEGRWLVDHISRPIRDRHAPIRPPAARDDTPQKTGETRAVIPAKPTPFGKEQP
ncbi:MAG: TraV family lipoprotein [Azoarcus sp.]|jgi:conjugal transfer pilus assembly protein TraV|nr:TraV family lipoprotein [Azoarcus sp.]